MMAQIPPGWVINEGVNAQGNTDNERFWNKEAQSRRTQGVQAGGAISKKELNQINLKVMIRFNG